MRSVGHDPYRDPHFAKQALDNAFSPGPIPTMSSPLPPVGTSLTATAIITADEIDAGAAEMRAALDSTGYGRVVTQDQIYDLVARILIAAAHARGDDQEETIQAPVGQAAHAQDEPEQEKKDG